MSKKDELLETFKTMNKEDLLQYHKAATFAARAIDILGISTILLIMMYTIPLLFVPGGILLYVLSNICVDLNETRKLIEHRMIRMPGDK